MYKFLLALLCLCLSRPVSADEKMALDLSLRNYRECGSDTVSFGRFDSARVDKPSSLQPCTFPTYLASTDQPRYEATIMAWKQLGESKKGPAISIGAGLRVVEEKNVRLSLRTGKHFFMLRVQY